MAFRREVVDAIGFFDPRLGAGTAFRCEDIEYASRASLAGFVGAHVPEIVVFHHHGRKPGDEIEALVELNDVARGAYYAKRIREGRWKYVKGWVETVRWGKKSRRRLMRELRGAAGYLLDRLQNRSV